MANSYGLLYCYPITSSLKWNLVEPVRSAFASCGSHYQDYPTPENLSVEYLCTYILGKLIVFGATRNVNYY